MLAKIFCSNEKLAQEIQNILYSINSMPSNGSFTASYRFFGYTSIYRHIWANLDVKLITESWASRFPMFLQQFLLIFP